jgi:hypothetical protein
VVGLHFGQTVSQINRVALLESQSRLLSNEAVGLNEKVAPAIQGDRMCLQKIAQYVAQLTFWQNNFIREEKNSQLFGYF